MYGLIVAGVVGGQRMAVGRGRQSDIALKNEENRFINKKVSNLQFNLHFKF